MSISDINNTCLTIDQYRIDGARTGGKWKDVSNIEVRLTELENDEKVTVHALKYGWLYKHITDPKTGDLCLEDKEEVLHGVSINGVIVAFGKPNQERFESTVEMLSREI